MALKGSLRKYAVLSLAAFVLLPFPTKAENAITEAVDVIQVQRNPSFNVPEKLRPRVNFWKDIFAKYGKAQFVIHHRNYPQIVFMVVDLSREFNELDPVSFERLKSASEKRYTREVERAVERLAEDNQAETELERIISAKMQVLGAGSGKYRKILKDDLIRTQTGIKEKFSDSIKRSGRYLPLIEKIFVEDFALPVELSRLPFIESSFDYTAYSSVGAAGIWQFMPRTARLYMTVNKFIDERRDPLEASKAAAKYLRDAYRRLGSWPLAITSYNHGVGGVSSKVNRFGTSDIVELVENDSEQGFGFASKNFYPEFLAACEVYNDYRRYFPSLERDPPIHAREVEISSPVSASVVAQREGVSVEDLKVVNYAVSRAVWEGRYKIPAGYRLKVPDRNTALHLSYMKTDALKPLPEPAAASAIYGGTTYRVRKGDTLLSISKKFGTSVSKLKQLNRLSGSALKIGQSLVVTERENSGAPTTTSAPAPAPATSSLKPKKQDIIYKVKKGDTLWSISIKHGVSIDELRRANQGSIIGNQLTGGKTIVIPRR